MSRFSVSRLRTHLVLMALVAVTPALVITASTQMSEWRSARERAMTDNAQLTQLAARRSAGILEGLDRELATLSLLPAVRSTDPEACNALVRDVLRDHPGYIAFGVANADGSTFCLSAHISLQFGDSRWFQRVVQTRAPAAGGYQTARISGRPTLVLGHPLLARSGAVERVLFAGLDLNELQRLVSDGVVLPAGATLTLFDRERHILVRQPNAGQWVGRTLTDPELVAEPGAGGESVAVKADGPVGGPRLYAALPVTSRRIDTGAYVSIAMDRAVALAGADRRWRNQLWLLGLVSLIAMTAAWAGSEAFVLRPVKTLKHITDQIAKGDFGARAALTTGIPGLSDLRDAINEMAFALEVRQRERDRVAEDLRVSEERYRILFEDNPRPMWVYDPDTLRFLDVNQAAVEQYGYSRAEFLELTLGEISAEEDRPEVLARLRESGEAGQSGTSRHQAKDGRTLTVGVSTSAVRWAGRAVRLAIVEDITERKQLEDQLRQAQKMDAVGKLAGGVAHDFNNLLTAITGYSDLVLAQLDDDSPFKEDIQEIRRAGDRAAALTQQLLAFSRKQRLMPRLMDLNQVVRGMEPMLRRLIREDIALTLNLDAGLSPTIGDPGQIEQIVLNLSINARDAIPQSGQIVIDTSNVVLDAAFVRSHPGAVAGSYVSLGVRDTGVGMSAEVQAHVFEPFYTTKALGKGTGLGLSMVYGAVKQSGGYIALDSEVGRGAMFRVYLPVSAEAVVGVEGVLDRTATAVASETVLLADDEAGVRQLVRKMLEAHGYAVLEARNAVDALRIGSEHAGAIDLLISDVVMPEMNGPVLAERLAPMRPRMRVLFISGYVVRGGNDGAMLKDGVPFLQKPFSSDGLVRKAREVLEARQVA